MPRPTVNKTIEEKRAYNNAKASKYYQKNKKQIIEKTKLKYHHTILLNKEKRELKAQLKEIYLTAIKQDPEQMKQIIETLQNTNE